MSSARSATRTALVTGAAQGIGRAIAIRLAADGLDVAVNDLPTAAGALEDVAGEIRSAGRRTCTVPADVSSAAEVDTMVARAVAELGRLDVLVANAGIVHVGGLLDLDVDTWDRILGVNLRGMFLCYRAAARAMIAQGAGGKIIGAASVAAYKAGKSQGPYSASKFGVRGLTQTAAQEWAEHGITVNVYCPGIVVTPMWDSIDESFTAQSGAPRGSALHAMTDQIALRRLAQPEDVAGVVSFLASRDADYMTGQSIVVDGGFIYN